VQSSEYLICRLLNCRISFLTETESAVILPEILRSGVNSQVFQVLRFLAFFLPGFGPGLLGGKSRDSRSPIIFTKPLSPKGRPVVLMSRAGAVGLVVRLAGSTEDFHLQVGHFQYLCVLAFTPTLQHRQPAQRQ